MPLEATPEVLEKISLLSELANTFDQAAVALGVTVDELGEFMAGCPEALARWSRGGIDASNQLRVCLTKQALAGSTQASKVLIKIHEEAAGKKNAPASPAPTTTPTKSSGAGRAWRWAAIAEVARELGVTTKFIQNLVNEGKRLAQAGGANPVPMKPGRSDEWLVQPGAAYAWILERIARGISKRRPGGLLEPVGYADKEVPSAECRVPSEGRAAFENFDLDELTRVLNSDVSNEDKKLFVLAFHAARLKDESEEKKLGKIAREDVIKMLRSVGARYCEIIENLGPALAADLLRWLREKLDIDLMERNSAALEVVRQWQCDSANRLVVAEMRRHVEEAVEGVQVLEGVG